MASTLARDFSAPNETRTPPKTLIEVVNVGDNKIGRFTFQPGWRWSECIKPIAGTETCQTEHVGYVVSGSLHVSTSDGKVVELTPGQVYHIPPGHDGWNAGTVPTVMVEFQGAAHFALG